MPQRKRPLSPHLSVYKAQLSSVISVMQRVTGGGLGAGLACLLLWLGAAAYGPETYAWAQWVLTSWLGWLVLFGVSVSLAFHMCNGIRHLIWISASASRFVRWRSAASWFWPGRCC